MNNPRMISDLDRPVRTVMASVVIETKPADTLRSVIDLLAENDIGLVPVVEGGQLLGIVGERDLVRAIADGVDVEVERASDVMTFSAEAATPDDTVRQATAKMLEGGIRHLPVVKADGKLAGVLSMRDLLAAHAAIAD